MKKFWIDHKGLSMTPLLTDQDVILVEVMNANELKCGDIILFLDQTSNELTLHRLIALPFQTKGDLSLYAEINPVDYCLGKAIGFKRGSFYRVLPSSDSLFSKLYLYFSQLRMKGFFGRKLGRLFLFILTEVFEFYSEKTKLNHSAEQMLTDP